MIIGIVTQPLNGNFGGIMQNYALQIMLKRLGHLPITLDFISTLSYKEYLLTTLKSCFLYLFPKKRRYFIKRIKNRPEISNIFINQYINKTPIIYHYKKSFISKYKLDCIIVGSDQVWRPSYNRYIEDMFLKFAASHNIKRIAYAASFGVGQCEFTKREISKINPLLQKFDALSVRESSGEYIIKQQFCLQASTVLDPTLLLKRDDYVDLIKDMPVIHTSKLGVYILDMDDSKCALCNSILNGLGLNFMQQIGNSPNDICVEEWLCLFRDSKFIVTDSFHGTVFSLIFKKPFISISNKDRGQSRFVSLLEPLGLQSRIVEADNKNIDSIINQEINWIKIDEVLKEKREYSLEYLINALSKQ